jgi:YHS domain-containing protein
MATDPVCGKDIAENHWLANGAYRRFMAERPYYFCSLDCRRQFTANPAEYLVRRAGGTITAPFTLPNVEDEVSTGRIPLTLEKQQDTVPYSPGDSLDQLHPDTWEESSSEEVATPDDSIPVEALDSIAVDGDAWPESEGEQSIAFVERGADDAVTSQGELEPAPGTSGVELDSKEAIEATIEPLSDRASEEPPGADEQQGGGGRRGRRKRRADE